MGKFSRYRIDSDHLFLTLDNWDRLMRFQVKLIACGGTALTLMGIKESTTDADFTVPVETEHDRLLNFLRDLGYQEKGGGWAHPDDPHILFQFWWGNRVFTTNLLNPPLEAGRHVMIKNWQHIYVGALNLVDLITTKMFRGTSVDIEDSIAAFATGQVDADILFREYSRAAQYDLNPEKMMQNFSHLVERLHARKLVGDDFREKVRAEA